MLDRDTVAPWADKVAKTLDSITATSQCDASALSVASQWVYLYPATCDAPLLKGALSARQ